MIFDGNEAFLSDQFAFLIRGIWHTLPYAGTMPIV